METYHGHVRTPLDAIILFEACRIGMLPRVQRRLSEKERQQIKSGSVFVWDEREAGMRRWTDGKSWSASRVSGSFLTYREMEGKRGGGAGGNFPPQPTAPKRTTGKSPDGSATGDSDGEGPDGYRYKPDGLMKQSFSITTSSGQHLHLISYYSRSNSESLPQPSNDAQLRHIRPPKNMYPESQVNETAAVPALTRSPMSGSPYGPAQQAPSPSQRPTPPLHHPHHPHHPRPPQGGVVQYPHPYLIPQYYHPASHQIVPISYPHGFPHGYPQHFVIPSPHAHPHAHPQPAPMYYPQQLVAELFQQRGPPPRMENPSQPPPPIHAQRPHHIPPPPPVSAALPEPGPQLPAINGAIAKPPAPQEPESPTREAPAKDVTTPETNDNTTSTRNVPSINTLLNETRDDIPVGGRSGSRTPPSGGSNQRIPPPMPPGMATNSNATEISQSALSKLNSSFR